MNLDVGGWLRSHSPAWFAGHGGDEASQPDLSNPSMGAERGNEPIIHPSMGGPSKNEPIIHPSMSGPSKNEPIILGDTDTDTGGGLGPYPQGAESGNEP